MADFNLFGKTISDINGFTIPDTNGVDHDFSERIVFTQTWDTEYASYTLSCNKSYAECYSLLIEQNARTCAVFVIAYPGNERNEYSLNFAGKNDGTLSFYFIAPYMFVADIDYNEDGTVEYTDPSTHVTSLTVTENGYYSYSGVYSDVTVNVKKAFTANIVFGGTPNRSYVKYNNDYYYIVNDYFGFSAGDTLHIYANATTYSQIVINGVTVATRNSGGVLEYDYILPSSDIKIDLSGSTATIVTSIWETPVLKTKNITANGTYTASSDSADGYSSVTVNVPSGTPTLQTKTVTPTTSEQSVTPDTGYDGLSSVTVNAMPSGSMGTPTATKGTVSNHSISVTSSVTNTAGYISGGTVNGTAVSVSASELASGSETKTANGTYDVTNLAELVVDVPPTTPNLQSKTVTPSESQQTVTADSGYDGLSAVTVNAVSSTYVGTGIDRNDSTDLTASGATVTVPAGYYAEQASKAVASGSATTPATSVTANPSISVSASGLITATASATRSVTPTVSAGYVSSGTAGTVTVSGSNTQQLSTQAATTITPSTSQQTAVAAGKYTTGAVTVAPIPSNYIIPSGNLAITENGDDIDVSQYETVSVNVSGGSSMNTQVWMGRANRHANSYGATSATLTVAKTGTYTVSWTAWRSSSQGTMGTNLHVNNTSGTNQTTFTNTYGQQIQLTNQNYNAGDVLTIYATSGSSSRSINVSNLIIVQTA